MSNAKEAIALAYDFGYALGMCTAHYAGCKTCCPVLEMYCPIALDLNDKFSEIERRLVMLPSNTTIVDIIAETQIKG